MLEGLKRLWSRAGGSPAGWPELEECARSRGWHLAVVREAHGFVIEGRLAGFAWRAEWGPSQRNYIEGQELRLRAEMPARAQVQALLLPRALQSDMENRVFDQIVEGVQTRIDDQTPPEMRWLVMHPKLPVSDLGALRERFVVVGPSRPWLQQWLTPEFGQSLLAAPVSDEQPIILMITRGRMTLRTPLAEPSVASIQPWMTVFEAALRSLPEIDVQPSTAGPATGASLLGDDEPGPPAAG